MAPIVLGLNGLRGLGHDAAAALVVDGRVEVAVEEERIARVKRAFGLPPIGSMREVLEVSGRQLSDVDVVAYPWFPSAMGVDPADAEEHIRSWFAEAELRPRRDLRIRFIPHHLAHAWSGVAFISGGGASGRVGILVLDGSGESTSGAAYFHESEPRQLWTVSQDSSPGIYFEAVTQFLGFEWGQEGKTMALASYARNDAPVPLLPDRRTFTDSLPAAADGEPPRLVHERVRWGFVDRLAALHGSHLSFHQMADIAQAAQQVVGERILKYVSEIVDGLDVLVLSGGVALNCAINSLVAAMCRDLHIDFVVPPPASDTGVAIGAALAASAEECPIMPIDDPFLGRDFAPSDVVRLLHAEGEAPLEIGVSELAADLIERSLICGWFEGRSEVGPRALGKRSIIARADSPEVRDRISVLKGREYWRPLAPSVTEHEFGRTFSGSVPSPFMLITASAVEGARHRLEGVIHVDNTSRPQVVRSQGVYRDLLIATGELTGTEALTCTSFNRAGEPIVYSPVDALRSAREMHLDGVAGDGWFIGL